VAAKPLAALLCGLAAALAVGGARGQTRGDVFAGNSSDAYSAKGAVLSLRRDAANGTGAPQLGLDAAYPPSLQGWLDVKRQIPGAAALYDACANLLIQATDEIRRVAPLMRRPITRLKELNDGIARARALVGQGDTCIARVDKGGGTRLSGGATTIVPRPTPTPLPSTRRVPEPRSGGHASGDVLQATPADEPPLRDGVASTDRVPPRPPTRGYEVPLGFVQPNAPNYVCYDAEGYPYTVMIDPGAQTEPYQRVPRFGVKEPPRIPPERGGYDECINPNPPYGCPPSDIRRTYRPIKASEPCRPPPARQRAADEAAPVFHYYYVNGINTSEHDPGARNGRAVNRGSYDWDRQLIRGNLLGLGPAVNVAGVLSHESPNDVAAKINVVPNEINKFDERTYNVSGARPYFEEMCRLDKSPLVQWLCINIRQYNEWRATNGNGMAGGDLLECALQAISRDSIDVAADNDDVVRWVDRIVKTYRDERAGSGARSKHYFILIGHSQGNFLVEGMAWRLQNRSGAAGREIFESRLAILALASPTDYPSLQSGSFDGTSFVARHLKHATRADDAILSLRPVGQMLNAKTPFAATMPALWPYRKSGTMDALRDHLRIVTVLDRTERDWLRYSSPMLDALKLTPGVPCTPQGDPVCNEALYTPLMNSHLIDNYLTDPTLTRPGQPVNAQLRTSLDMARMNAPFPAVLNHVRDLLKALKFGLVGR